jgi:hypothetical protein
VSRRACFIHVYRRDTHHAWRQYEYHINVEWLARAERQSRLVAIFNEPRSLFERETSLSCPPTFRTSSVNYRAGGNLTRWNTDARRVDANLADDRP